MNQQERDDLRARHIPSTAQDDWSKCPNCRVPVKDCNVIKVLDDLDQIAFWADHHNGMDVHGAIGRIQEMLL